VNTPSTGALSVRGAGDEDRTCEDRLRFETLLSDLSARFINMPADHVDLEIEDALREVCEDMGFDVAVLWQWEVDAPGAFTLTHHYRRLEGPPLSRQVQAGESFPWGLREVQAGRSFLLASLDDVPEDAVRDRESYRKFGVKNALLLVLAVGGGAPFGAISFHDMVTPRIWSDALIHRLEMVARIFASTLARKRHELTLRENEERLALAADSAGAGLWSLNLATGRYWTTDKAREIFGFVPGEAVTLDRVLAATHSEDRVFVQKVIDEAVAKGIEGFIEYRIIRPDGSSRRLASRGRVHGPPGKPPTHLMGVTIDVTDSKIAEESLRQSEFRLAAAMDVAELGFYEVTNGDRVTYLDRRAREIIGASKADEDAGRIFEYWGGHVHPEDLPSVMELNRVLNEGGQDRLTVDYRFLKPEHGVIFIHHLVHVIERDASGRAVRTIGVLQDVTERKRAEESIRKSEYRLASAIETAELGLYEEVGPPDNRVTTADERALRLAGDPLDPGGFLREYWIAHLCADDLEYVLSTVRGFDTGGQDLVTMEYRYRHEERGLVWLRHLVRALARDGDGRVVRLVGVLQDITERKTREEDLCRALAEVQKLRDQLTNENLYLREQMRSESGHGAIVGESEAIQRMFALAGKVATTGAAVLITGETGTGKELLAQAIHDLSSRKQTTMVKVNCAALPALLIEGELFGREKGAYTGAMTQQIGRFEIADGSTIFLDEIGDLPLDLQVKLLRVLQEGEFQRLGSPRTVKVDVRVIAATNRDLATMVREGRFREDLFHRLNVFPIVAPPLRERITDIPLLVWKFVEEFNRKMGRSIDSIPKPLMERLKQYQWPGNVRELRNMVERAMIVSDGRTLMIELPDSQSGSAAAPSKTLTHVERHHILDVLESTRWRISGKGGAAEVLGLDRSTLRSRMKNLGIVRP
jgi:PAS domain S-box-containing protein